MAAFIDLDWIFFFFFFWAEQDQGSQPPGEPATLRLRYETLKMAEPQPEIERTAWQLWNLKHLVSAACLI